MSAPISADLGSAAPGGALSGDLGTVQVTDNRGFGVGWTATVSATGFSTGGGTPAETIPASNAAYDVSGFEATTGSATFITVPVTTLDVTPQPIASATNVNGGNSATWDPLIVVTVPSGAVSGQYSATITHSVS